MQLLPKAAWIFIFALTVFTFDRILGLLIKQLYFSQKSGDRFAITYALDSTRADMLIFGSSRAIHHYMPSVFEDSVRLSCYNAGRDGEGISFNYALLIGISRRYLPSFIILDLDTESLYKKRRNSDNLNSLLPYYHANSQIRDLLIQKREFERFKQFSVIYPYNSTILSSAMGILAKSPAKIAKGFLPLDGKISESKYPSIVNLGDQEIDIEKVQDFKNFIHFCKVNKVKLFVVQSPRYEIIKNDRVSDIADSILKVENIPGINYKRNTYFLKRPSLFSDAAHLNNNGAKIFSNMVSGDIRNKVKTYW